MLKGGEHDARYPLPAEWRDYLLASKFGWDYEQIQEQPAVWLDWLIMIDSTVEEVKANAIQG